jgi:hypothetical protein
MTEESASTPVPDETVNERGLREAHEALGHDYEWITSPQPPGSGDYKWDARQPMAPADEHDQTVEVKHYDRDVSPNALPYQRANKVRYKLQDAVFQKSKGIEEGRTTFGQVEIDTTGTSLNRDDFRGGVEEYVQWAAKNGRHPEEAFLFDVIHSHRDAGLSWSIAIERDELKQRVETERGIVVRDREASAVKDAQRDIEAALEAESSAAARILEQDRARIARAKEQRGRSSEVGRGRERER